MDESESRPKCRVYVSFLGRRAVRSLKFCQLDMRLCVYACVHTCETSFALANREIKCNVERVHAEATHRETFGMK